MTENRSQFHRSAMSSKAYSRKGLSHGAAGRIRTPDQELRTRSRSLPPMSPTARILSKHRQISASPRHFERFLTGAATLRVPGKCHGGVA